MLGVALAPNLLTLGSLLAIAAAASSRSNIARTFFVTVVLSANFRYILWRWTDTVLDEWWTVEGFYTFFCFFFELMILADTVVGMIVLSRTIDRRGQADDGEAWARAQPPGMLPSVDVLIATYNEERDVLERTIVGATSLDYPNFTVWVLDDGRRPWVAELAAAKGAMYLTRADNAHAKAGNINAALPRTTSELIVVLDADFVPRTQLLWRTVGFFRDPLVACVQTPQYFFNKDPTQTNLGLAARWVDDQRLFFDVIMPSWDAWGVAFCCGTGFVLRRSAIEAIGGIPTQSICEDMLTSIELKRRGLETIYLREELCIGLAPESIDAFFVQRRRWARGQIQIMLLKNGAFGPGLPLFYRVVLLPGYWALQLPARIAYVLIPIILLLFGLSPLVARDSDALIGHLGPAMIGSAGLTWWLARSCYFPIVTDASALFCALRLVPSTLLSLIKPFGAPFAVTPKGAAAKGRRSDRLILYICLGLVIATVVGMAANALDDWRMVQDRGTLAFATFWASVNCIVLGLTAMIAQEGQRYRAHERFPLALPVRCMVSAEPTPCRIIELSLTGAFARFGNHPVPEAGSTVLLSIAGIGQVIGLVVRIAGDGAGIRFAEIPDAARVAIRRLRSSAGAPGRPDTRRAALRIQFDARARLASASGWSDCTISDASLSGALLDFADMPSVGLADPVIIDVPQVGMVSARVARKSENALALAFEDVSDHTRDDLIRFLYTVPRQVTMTEAPQAITLFRILARRLFGPDLVGEIRPSQPK